MAQHDYNIVNDSGLGVRTDLNALFSAIVTQNSGDTEPSVTYPFQWWSDTLTGYLKQRNAANDAWLIRWDTTKGQLATLASPTFTGNVTLPSTTFIDGNALAVLASPTFTGTATFANITASGTISLPAATTIGAVSATELSYLDGVTSAIQSQLTALSSGKQATLVSGTNIKTVGGNSLLGSGDIVITQNPSGVFANSQTFTSSGSFTVPAGVTQISFLVGYSGSGGGGGTGAGSSQNGNKGGIGGVCTVGSISFGSMSGGAGGGSYSSGSTGGAGAGWNNSGGVGGIASNGGSPDFNFNGLYTVPAGGEKPASAVVKGVGGAGGTSNCNNGTYGGTATSNGCAGGGGGGASVFSPLFVMPVTVGQNISIVIGAGGAGGAGYTGAGAGGAGGAGKVIVYW